MSGSSENDNVVRTGSGSRYFLSSGAGGQNVMAQKAAQAAMNAAKPGVTINLFNLGKEQERRESAAKAKKTVDSAKPRTTISLFGLFGDKDDKDVNRPSVKTPTQKRAPSGVPSLVRWRKNSDGSITGFISGSRAFADGERVTTSPIASGNAATGKVVKTGSGSSYFLV